MMTAKQIAQRLNCSRRVAVERIQKEMEFIQLRRGDYRVEPEEFERWLKTQRKSSSQSET